MQKENPVIKNYIFSSEKRVLRNDAERNKKPDCHHCNKSGSFSSIDTCLYHKLLEQNKACPYLSPSRIRQMYHQNKNI